MQASEIIAILKRAGKKPNKLLGQHFLMDEEVLEDMLKAAKIGQEDLVLEVGPGLGVLTKLLAKQAGQVLAVEKDDTLKQVLKAQFGKQKNVQIVYGDILKLDLAKYVTQKYKVVANLPYYATSPIIQYFLHQNLRPESLTLLVQKEVGQNMVAAKGRLNLLALAIKLYADVSLVRQVPAKAFFPAPKVESVVVHLQLRSKPLVTALEEVVVFRVARALFSGKRKQIHNTLKANLGLADEQVKTVLAGVGLKGSERPEHLSVEKFISLGQAFSKLKLAE